MIAQVIFNLPIDRAFDYLIPPEWESILRPGMRVEAPFGRRHVVGYVLKTAPNTLIREPKTLRRLLDDAPMLPADHWTLARWMADYYGCSVGEAVSSMVPARVRFGIDQEVGEPSGPAQAVERPVLTAPQQRAFEAVREAIDAGRTVGFLLHGVTGSGKTELYLRLIEEALRRGRSAISLVPEIMLTPQTIDRFRQRFGDAAAVWHSRLTARERGATWQRLSTGRCRIVVGTRSAVLVPLRDVGIIILDEEHDPSYKQPDSPRYHAREVALARARQTGAVVLLGSATPSVESYDAATRGRLRLLELPQRVQGRELPKVDVVDLRQEVVRGRRGALLSLRLQRAVEQTVTLKEQAILLLNRRGFARIAQCPACGMVVRCHACAVPLIYHATTPQLRCHYCGWHEPVPDTCTTCAKGFMRLKGAGTQRIESELHRLFPEASIARMDSDAAAPKDSHRRLYDVMAARRIDLLVGTQMVAKGLDLPHVTLVGVVSADTSLNLPDFRAGERTFELLTQVAGRAGRGHRPGRVIVQTFCPTHYAIQAASRHDYHAFYREEIAMRRRLQLPPFTHLVELTVHGARRSRVEQAVQAFAEALRAKMHGRAVRLLGPAPHRLATLRGTHRWRLVLKAKQVEPMLRVVRGVLQEGRRFRGLPVSVDVDPL